MLLRALAERRSGATSSVSNPADWLISLLGGGRLSRSGQRVNGETALSHMAVWNAIRILSSTVASLPLILYKRLPSGGKVPAIDHPLYFLTHDRPNPWQTSYEWREMVTGHLELRGNAYIRIDMDRRGQILSLTPLHPDRMVIYLLPDLTAFYHYTDRFGKLTIYSAEQILHLRGLAADTVVGYSPVTVARETIGVGLAAEEYASSFFGNSATPGGVLQHPAKLSDNAYKRLKANIEARYSGAENAGRTMVLEEGLTWQQIGMTSKDAQFLETRKFGVEEIARLFDIPVHMLKELARSTNNNIEQQGMEFVLYTMRPRLVRICQRLNESLLLERERKDYFFKFQTDELARGDTKSRFDAYNVARSGGWMNADEIRDQEDMNPMPDGEGKIYLRPVNMTPVSAPASDDPADPSNSDDDDPPSTDDDEDQRAQLLAVAEEAMRDAFRRCAGKERIAATRQLERSSDLTELSAWHETFWRQQAEYVTQELRPIVRLLVGGVRGLKHRTTVADAIVSAAMTRERDESRMALLKAIAEGADAVRALLDEWNQARCATASARERDILHRTLPRGSHEIAA